MLFIDINVVGETVAGFLLLPAGGAAGGPGGGSEEEADYRGDAGQQPAEVVGDAARRWAWNPLGVATDEERRFPPPAGRSKKPATVSPTTLISMNNISLPHQETRRGR